MPFVLYLCGISFSDSIRCRHTWLPTDLSLLPPLFPSLPSPCLPSSPTGHPFFISFFLSDFEEWMHYFLGMPSLSWPAACHPYTHTPRHFSMQQIKELFPCQQCFAEEDELQRTRILLLLLLAGFWEIFHQLGGVCVCVCVWREMSALNIIKRAGRTKSWVLETSSQCAEERKERDRIFPERGASHARLCAEFLAVPAAPMPQDAATGCSYTLRQQRTAKSTPQSYLRASCPSQHLQELQAQLPGSCFPWPAQDLAQILNTIDFVPSVKSGEGNAQLLWTERIFFCCCCSPRHL